MDQLGISIDINKSINTIQEKESEIVNLFLHYYRFTISIQEKDGNIYTKKLTSYKVHSGIIEINHEITFNIIDIEKVILNNTIFIILKKITYEYPNIIKTLMSNLN